MADRGAQALSGKNWYQVFFIGDFFNCEQALILEGEMMDILFVGLTVLFFLISGWFMNVLKNL